MTQIFYIYIYYVCGEYKYIIIIKIIKSHEAWRSALNTTIAQYLCTDRLNFFRLYSFEEGRTIPDLKFILC